MRYKNRVDMLAQQLKEVGFSVVIPEGAYYLFVDYRGVAELNGLQPMAAAMHLMQNFGVACVPGDNFYGKSSEGQHFVRFAACRSIADIKSAIERLKRLTPL